MKTNTSIERMPYAQTRPILERIRKDIAKHDEVLATLQDYTNLVIEGKLAKVSKLTTSTNFVRVDDLDILKLTQIVTGQNITIALTNQGESVIDDDYFSVKEILGESSVSLNQFKSSLSDWVSRNRSSRRFGQYFGEGSQNNYPGLPVQEVQKYVFNTLFSLVDWMQPQIYVGELGNEVFALRLTFTSDTHIFVVLG